MWHINFKPLKGEGEIRRKMPQSFQKNEIKEEKGNKGREDILLWVAPKAKPEMKACVQAVYFETWPRDQQWGLGRVRQGRMESHSEAALFR